MGYLSNRPGEGLTLGELISIEQLADLGDPLEYLRVNAAGTGLEYADFYVVSKSVYTGTDTIDDVYLHVCDSISDFTLTVTDGNEDGEQIKIMNRGVGMITLSGKISNTTALSSLFSGETIVLNWDSTDDEWQ